MSDIKTIIKEKASRIERIIEDALPQAEGFSSTVTEAMNYSIRVGGKRLRPMLMEECYRLFADDRGGVDEELLQLFMASIECIHNYSLVHDDLPAMDDDMLRRGMPTTHAKYGEAMAILAGDALLNYAMELSSRAVTCAVGDDILVTAQCQRILFERAGIYGMIGGQCADVEAEKQGLSATEERLDYIHRCKTGALIDAAMMVGARLGGASGDETGIVHDMAMRLGLAFQIRDDILDVEGDEATFGKPIGSDAKNEKLTYVSLHGVEASQQKVAQLTEEAHRLLDKLPGEHDFLHELFDELTSREI